VQFSTGIVDYSPVGSQFRLWRTKGYDSFFSLLHQKINGINRTPSTRVRAVPVHLFVQFGEKHASYSAQVPLYTVARKETALQFHI
jgi:hypothetical protein